VGFLQANVAFALRRPEIAPELAPYIKALAKRL
jgi:hypothetical protein